jgi:hypothetical protein
VPGSGAEMAPGFGVRVEHSCRFDHDIDRELAPGEALRIAFLEQGDPMLSES